MSSAMRMEFLRSITAAQKDGERKVIMTVPALAGSQGFSGFDVTRADLRMVTHTRARVRRIRGLVRHPQRGGGTVAGGLGAPFGGGGVPGGGGT
jgi:hypothetical protein